MLVIRDDPQIDLLVKIACGRGVFLRFASQKKRRSPCRPRRLRADRAGIGSVGEPEGREP